MRRISVPLMAPILVIVIVVALVAAGCGGSSQTYSKDEVREVFARLGSPLEEERGRPGLGGGGISFGLIATDLPATRDELVLAPFTVVVASDSEADDAWPTYVAQQDARSFDARRANVVVVSNSRLGLVSDDGFDAERRALIRRERTALAMQRVRIRGLLAALPDRGFPVVIAS